jgi:hypothetical protein
MAEVEKNFRVFQLIQFVYETDVLNFYKLSHFTLQLKIFGF